MVWMSARLDFRVPRVYRSPKWGVSGGGSGAKRLSASVMEVKGVVEMKGVVEAEWGMREAEGRGER